MKSFWMIPRCLRFVEVLVIISVVALIVETIVVVIVEMIVGMIAEVAPLKIS